ncbi:hypothetical protein CBR_g17744 [Chara braunii]|uniref:Reverse transcriptase domain-containing protein n=1 Tax=Chara braunii TaxID=69332 RepID=A0A388KVD7_CHABU|nr:hypothetical protein CBR_g17744 [Chara braunii]|eukprot:GBG74034.1 hypothetical protein CBR_g17744 [Chara braunii]
MGQVSLDRGQVQVPRSLRLLLLVQQHQAQDLPVPVSDQGVCSASYQLGKLSCAGGETTPPLTPPDSTALLATSYTSGEDANVVSSRYTYEDYAVHLVLPLDQPLHMQQSTACTVSSPSTTDLEASPSSIAEDSTSWSRLEELDLLTFTDFQWMPVPPTGGLTKPHCNVLMAPLRDNLHTAVPTPLMDTRVEVIDLHAYIVKIDREFKTQRYEDIDAPLLYVRIQIREATCTALIDCGASRNYMSQDFMVRAGLGPRVRRNSLPIQVTLAYGHTHKSIDRCIDAVPVYFAPPASEAVSFDILDTKFDMILGMSWLRSEDYPVNFYHRTIHIRDPYGVLVPCTVPLPHPSICCHVVSAASMRTSIIRDDIEEMSVSFLHALPPHNASSTDSSSDPRITEFLDTYGNMFEDPHRVAPDGPIHHEIILEDGAVPPRSCIFRMSEEELSVLWAQLDDLLEEGWIWSSSSPYGQLAKESLADYKQQFQTQLALIEAEERCQLAAEAARLQAEAAATAEKQRLMAEADAVTQSYEDATRALNSRVLDLEQAAPGPDAGVSSNAPSNRQLEERVDHVVAMLGDISTFAAPTTISNQLDTLKTKVQQLQLTNTDGNSTNHYKMPTFQIEKFDDYTH